MDYSKIIVVVSVVMPFFVPRFKDNLIKSNHSNCSHQAQLTASQRLQVHKENTLTERARWKQNARSETSTVSRKRCHWKSAL